MSSSADEWFMLEGHTAESNVEVLQENHAKSTNSTENWYRLDNDVTEEANRGAVKNQSIDDNNSHINESISSISINSLSQTSSTKLMIHGEPRLNLQESIDGEISSESHIYSTLTNSILLNPSRDEERKKSLSSVEREEAPDFEWINLEKSNIQDINRPEPVGFAKSDSSVKLSSNSSNTSSLNHFKSSLADSLYSHTDDTQAAKSQSSSLSSYTTDSFVNSVRTSSTVYKEISPERLLDSGFKETEAFLRKLLRKNISDQSNVSSSYLASRMDQSMQAGKSFFSSKDHDDSYKKHVNAYEENEPDAALGVSDVFKLQEQDISSASNSDSKSIDSDLPSTIIGIKGNENLAKNEFLSDRNTDFNNIHLPSESIKSSDGSLLMSDLTENTTNTSKTPNTSSLISSRSKNQYSSISSSLTPIQEIPIGYRPPSTTHNKTPSNSTTLSNKMSSYSSSFKSTSVCLSSSSNSNSRKYTSFKLNFGDRSVVDRNRKLQTTGDFRSKPERISSRELSSNSYYHAPDLRINDISKRFGDLKILGNKNHQSIQSKADVVEKDKYSDRVSDSEDTDNLLSYSPSIENRLPDKPLNISIEQEKNRSKQANTHNKSRSPHSATSNSPADDLTMLWNDFDKSFTKKHRQPVSKKLQLLTELLKNERVQRKYLISSPDTSDSPTTTSVDDSSPNTQTDETPKTTKTSTFKQKPFAYSPQQTSCPYCKKQEASTNFPTPPSHGKSMTPLMLQTWTQTFSPTKENLYRKTSAKKSYNESSKVIFNDKRRTKDSSDESVSRNNIQSTVLKPESNNFEQSNRKRAHTKGFALNQPIHWAVNLNEKVAHSNKSDSSYKNTLTLQEAFLRRKKNFIQRSRLRQQYARDVRLNENYRDVPKFKSETKRQPVRKAKPCHISQASNIPQVSKRSYRNVPLVSYRELQEEKRNMLKSNRLKMKQYDAKVRSRFLRRQPIRHHGYNFSVKRHR